MLTLALAVAFSMGGIALAQTDSPLLQRQPVAEIYAQQQALRADVQAQRNGWDAIPLEKRNELLSRQQRLLVLLSGKSTLADLDPNGQVEVANTLEWIQALATDAEEDRKVCWRERKTGSLRVTTLCRTVGELNAQRERDKMAMRDGERAMQSPPKTPAEP